MVEAMAEALTAEAIAKAMTDSTAELTAMGTAEAKINQQGSGRDDDDITSESIDQRQY
jgi:hypothetical protein